MVRLGNSLEGLCILIVEDDWLLAGLLGDLIELYGGTVAGPVASLEDALSAADGTHIQCALLDISLNGSPCYALIDKLTRRNVPVILATGHDRSAVPDQFQHLPIFMKPYNLGQLVERIAGHCQRGFDPAVGGASMCGERVW